MGKKRRRLQEWEQQAILDACKDGEKIMALCYEFNISRWAIQKLRRRNGVRCYVRTPDKKRWVPPP